MAATHPAIHHMFDVSQRDADPPPALDPWSGGLAGLHLAATAQSLAVGPDEQLRAAGDAAVQSLLSHRTPHGYIGPWPSKFEVRT